MSLSEFEIKKTEKVVGEYIESKRPAPHIRKELDLAFEIKDQSVEIFEIRPRWNNPEEYHNIPVAKATYVKTQKVWKIYWQRADLKWHSYEPDSTVKNIEEFISVVEQDKHACFWG
jgi:hypothetical protein